jgi:hypothetical protein
MASLDKDWDQFIDELSITGDVLELACRTLLGARARSVTAVDVAPGDARVHPPARR